MVKIFEKWANPQGCFFFCLLLVSLTLVLFVSLVSRCWERVGVGMKGRCWCVPTTFTQALQNICGEGKGRFCRWCCNWVEGFLARNLVVEFVGITPWWCNFPLLSSCKLCRCCILLQTQIRHLNCTSNITCTFVVSETQSVACDNWFINFCSLPSSVLAIERDSTSLYSS